MGHACKVFKGRDGLGWDWIRYGIIIESMLTLHIAKF